MTMKKTFAVLSAIVALAGCGDNNMTSSEFIRAGGVRKDGFISDSENVTLIYNQKGKPLTVLEAKSEYDCFATAKTLQILDMGANSTAGIAACIHKNADIAFIVASDGKAVVVNKAGFSLTP